MNAATETTETQSILDTTALEPAVLAELAFGETSDIYRELRLEQQRGRARGRDRHARFTDGAAIYDTVYYWTGGREQGQWNRTYGNCSITGLNGTRHKCRIAGYVAHLGSTRIGPPEGAPCEEQFADIGM